MNIFDEKMDKRYGCGVPSSSLFLMSLSNQYITGLVLSFSRLCSGTQSMFLFKISMCSVYFPLLMNEGDELIGNVIY